MAVLKNYEDNYCRVLLLILILYSLINNYCFPLSYKSSFFSVYFSKCVDLFLNYILDIIFLNIY